MSKYLDQDIETIWPGHDLTEYTYIEQDVDDAEVLVDTRFPDLESHIETGVINKAAAGLVIKQMVSRALEYDDRSGASSITLPELGVTYETGGGAGTGSRLFLTVDELLLLTPQKRKSRRVRNVTLSTWIS